MSSAAVAAAAAAVFFAAVPLGATAEPLYSSGVPNGTLSAYTIGGPYSVTQQFTLAENSSIDRFEATLWTDRGNTPQALTWHLGTVAFSSELGTGSTNLDFTFIAQTNVCVCDVYSAWFSVADLQLQAGDYYLTLADGTQSSGFPLMWDIVAPAYDRNGWQATIGMQYAVWDTTFSVHGRTVPVPEPGSLPLLVAGFSALVLARRKSS